MSAIFVAGTDTNVGKTHVCGLLLDFLFKQGIKAGYQKWVATGPEYPPSDLVECLRVAGRSVDPDAVEWQVPYHFSLAASPHLAAEQEGACVDPALIRKKYQEMVARHELLVVEGVGGLMVPLRRDLLFVDFLGRLKIPTLLVARSGLGTINHTLLSLAALRERKIPLLGVVFSDAAPSPSELLVEDNLRTIAEMGRVSVFGRVPYSPEIDQSKDCFAPIGQTILATIQKTFLSR